VLYIFITTLFVLKLFSLSFHRSARSGRKIIPLDKWEFLPEQVEHEEELGRGAFGVVYKATLKRRVGIEVFDTQKTLKPEEPGQVVAVKELQGNCNHHGNPGTCIKWRIVAQLANWVGPVSLNTPESHFSNMQILMHQSTQAVPIPSFFPATAGHLLTLSIPGLGHLKFYRGLGATWGDPRAFDIHVFESAMDEFIGG